MSNIETKFSAWLAGEISQAQVMQKIEQLPEAEQTLWLQRVEQSLKLTDLAAQLPKQQVPDWQPENLVPAQQSAYILRSQFWWPKFSVACSVLALVMVLFNGQINLEQGKFSVAFGTSTSSQAVEQQVQQLVKQQVSNALAQQQQSFNQTLTALIKQQKQNDLALSQYLLTASRKERNQDIKSLVQYLNQQRADDVLVQDLKYQQLANNILTQSQQP